MPGRKPARESVSRIGNPKSVTKGAAKAAPRTSAQKAVAGRAQKADAKGASRQAAREGKSRARAAGLPVGPQRATPRPRSGDARVGKATQEVKGLGGEQVEGRQAVRELLKAGRRRVREVWIADDIEHADIVTEIERLAAKAPAPVRYVTRNQLERQARTDAAQGILALAADVVEADFERLAADPRAFLLCLDGVTDPHNLGAVLRSAEYAGVTGAVIPRHRAVHVTPTVTKAAAGAVERVPMALVSGMPTALVHLGAQGVLRIGLDQDGPTSLWDLDLGQRPVALVLGSEGTGLSKLVRQRCDVLVRIPRAGSLDSLNVASAGAVALLSVAQARARAEHKSPTADITPSNH